MADDTLQPGQLLARGVCRHLRDHDFTCLEEFSPERGKRLDVMALGPKGEFWIVECKSSRADFTCDAKWQGYLEWSDRYFWAVDTEFPTYLLPPETGLILADAFGAEVVRMPGETKLAPARRKALTLRFARAAALRLQWARDPMMAEQAG
ncbi:MmcB family DNA repair protein [Jannaschia marina]|uniref:MmcB family DNA repair protein n=1 Tax=Jannaschia marina TaxID=2741674 RepID=UPI0015C8B288|nr:MmcB family DNA repair protein [Jannaschia marina]